MWYLHTSPTLQNRRGICRRWRLVFVNRRFRFNRIWLYTRWVLTRTLKFNRICLHSPWVWTRSGLYMMYSDSCSVWTSKLGLDRFWRCSFWVSIVSFSFLFVWSIGRFFRVFNFWLIKWNHVKRCSNWVFIWCSNWDIWNKFNIFWKTFLYLFRPEDVEWIQIRGQSRDSLRGRIVSISYFLYQKLERFYLLQPFVADS